MATNVTKRYKARSLRGAETRVRNLQKQLEECSRLYDECWNDRRLLAMLAADGPCFHNPLAAMKAKNIRDRVLRAMKLAPDGTQL